MKLTPYEPATLRKARGLNFRYSAKTANPHRCIYPRVRNRLHHRRFSVVDAIKYSTACLILLMISGCMAWSERYGKISYLSNDSNEITIQALIDNWQNYDISYAGLDVRLPLGIMFDPKNNETTLVGDCWKTVANQQTLMEIARWIYPNTQYPPKLSKILGPDGRFYGYLYHSYGPVFLKQVDDRKIYVYNLEEPIEEGLGESLP